MDCCSILNALLYPKMTLGLSAHFSERKIKNTYLVQHHRTLTKFMGVATTPPPPLVVRCVTRNSLQVKWLDNFNTDFSVIPFLDPKILYSLLNTNFMSWGTTFTLCKMCHIFYYYYYFYFYFLWVVPLWYTEEYTVNVKR